jgi:hypothetical protein
MTNKKPSFLPTKSAIVPHAEQLQTLLAVPNAETLETCHSNTCIDVERLRCSEILWNLQNSLPKVENGIALAATRLRFPFAESGLLPS